MNVEKIVVNNFRLLRDFEVNLEDDMSLVIGKNNTGKTSLLTILLSFLIGDRNAFSFEDINLEAQNSFQEKFQQGDFDENYEFGISLRLYISYNREDDLSNISSLMLDLSPNENIVVVKFSYSVTYEEIERIKERYSEEHSDTYDDILSFLKENHNNYFKIRKRALEYNNEDNFVKIDNSQLLDKVINFKRIRAKRDVVNTDGVKNKSDKTLSRKSSDYYEKISSPEEEIESIKGLKQELSNTDEVLDDIYNNIFESLKNKVKKFGGTEKGESAIEIRSSLEEEDLLSNNTVVEYNQDGHLLPEDYYGLGYLNLIAIIFEIEVIIKDFKKETIQREEPSDINLFFIEEPEVHTHPQMQYIFINHIKDLLREESQGEGNDTAIDLQTIITTHSSHITAESDFADIKYFKRENTNRVVSKDLKNLKQEYENDDYYKFLQKYLTLNRAELFFADKAVFIEGDTERILLPSIMKKIDSKHEAGNTIPLYSQNISIIEVGGAYSHYFEKLIDFLGIKTLIITDIDSVNDDGEKCKVENGNDTSNQPIQDFIDYSSFEELKSLELEDRTFTKEDNDWVADAEGQAEEQLLLAYQQEEKGYHARSFEDAFIHINGDFIENNKDEFRGLKNKDEFENPESSENDAYELVDLCVKTKTDFALDIIFNSNENFDNWEIPDYLTEGLLWLKK